MNTVLFDLDGTLLPMNMDDFMDTYFKALESRFETLGFDPEKIKMFMGRNKSHGC